MATLNAAQRKAAESAALKAASKSEGMRMLLGKGYTISETAAVFEAPYGFVYGVATRMNGGNAPEGANRRAPAAAKAASTASKASKAKTATRPARPVKAAATATKPARAAKAKAGADTRSPEAIRAAARRARVKAEKAKAAK